MGKAPRRQFTRREIRGMALRHAAGVVLDAPDSHDVRDEFQQLSDDECDRYDREWREELRRIGLTLLFRWQDHYQTKEEKGDA